MSDFMLAMLLLITGRPYFFISLVIAVIVLAMVANFRRPQK
jgi:hypothetical protein